MGFLSHIAELISGNGQHSEKKVEEKPNPVEYTLSSVPHDCDFEPFDFDGLPTVQTENGPRRYADGKNYETLNAALCFISEQLAGGKSYAAYRELIIERLKLFRPFDPHDIDHSALVYLYGVSCYEDESAITLDDFELDEQIANYMGHIEVDMDNSIDIDIYLNKFGEILDSEIDFETLDKRGNYVSGYVSVERKARGNGLKFTFDIN